METETVTPADVLRQASYLIEPEDAWCQGSFKHTDSEDNTSYCARGAMAKVLDLVEDSHALYRETVFFMEEVLDNGGGDNGRGDVIGWNDDDDRTQQEVVDMLRLAAKRWEEEHND